MAPPRLLLLLAAACCLAAPALAQEERAGDATAAVLSDALRERMDRGVEAFRAERFAEALEHFERVAEAAPEAAEAHYMIARVYAETPLADKRAALGAVRRARKIEPDNLQYMVAELQQLREPSWNNVAEFIQQEQRRSLARAILARDSTNAFAHEELGAVYIRDFWQYRNAIRLPGLSFGGSESETTLYEAAEPIDPAEIPVPAGSTPELAEGIADAAAFDAPGAVPLSDRFDLETLQSQGVAVQDLSARAQAAYDRAIGHLEAALRADPRRRPVYDHLMRIYTLNEDWDEAAAMLDRMLVFFPKDPGTWLYLGAANHRLGRADAAAVAFDEARERMTEEERAAFEDLALLLTDDDLRAYRADPDGFARAFWTARNPRYLTPYNERRLEHYARLVHADLLYAAPEIGKRGWQTQRGRVVVRYGPPERDVVITGAFEEALHAFGVVDDATEAGFRLDMAARSNLFNVWDYGDFKFVFEDPVRNGEFRLYSPPADLYSDRAAGFVEKMDYELIARRTFRETPERYDYEAAGRAVDVPYVVTAFKGDGGLADLYVHYGIPLGAEADLSADLVDLTLRTGAFLVDPEGGTLAERQRTLYGLKTAQVVSFEDIRLWTDTQALESGPGPHTVSVEFETAGGGTQATQRREVDVPAFPDDRLSVSDLLLAYAVEEVPAADGSGGPGGSEGVSGGRLRRGGLEILPAPWSVFGRRQPLYLYFEPYGLAVGADGRSRYTVEVSLRPKDQRSAVARLVGGLFGGDDRGVSVEFEAEGSGPDDQQYTILDVADQEPGVYTLTLRVRDEATGRAVERERDLFLE